MKSQTNMAAVQNTFKPASNFTHSTYVFRPKHNELLYDFQLKNHQDLKLLLLLLIYYTAGSKSEGTVRFCCKFFSSSFLHLLFFFSINL
jgi:hypothetical protein